MAEPGLVLPLMVSNCVLTQTSPMPGVLGLLSLLGALTSRALSLMTVPPRFRGRFGELYLPGRFAIVSPQGGRRGHEEGPEQFLGDVAAGGHLGAGDQLDLRAQVQSLGFRVVDHDRAEHVGVDLAREDIEPRFVEGLGHAAVGHLVLIHGKLGRAGLPKEARDGVLGVGIRHFNQHGFARFHGHQRVAVLGVFEPLAGLVGHLQYGRWQDARPAYDNVFFFGFGRGRLGRLSAKKAQARDRGDKLVVAAHGFLLLLISSVIQPPGSCPSSRTACVG